MNVHSQARPVLLASPAASASALLVAYAAGATLWAPVLVLVARLFAGGLGWMLPGVPVASAGGLFAAMWLLRFALYAIGARWGRDYGYGINGVIVNRELSLRGKARRVVRDWFGALLLIVWAAHGLATLVALVVGP